MNKKKVLFFCAFPNAERGFTGANIGTKVTYDLLKNDFDITVVDTGISDFNPHEKNLNHFLYNIKTFKNYCSKYFDLLKILKKEDFDFLYFLPASSIFGHLRDYITVSIARPYVKKIVGHVRNGNFVEIFKRKWHQKLTRKFVATVDAFIFLSGELKNVTCKFLPETKAYAAFNPIDDDIICTSEEVEKKIILRDNRNILDILYLSNMIYSKGYMDLAKAAVILKKSRISFKIHFIGRWNNSEDEEVMKSFIKENELESFVTLHGKITDRKKLKHILLESDVFVLPTYYPVEAQPRSIIEAMNAGTPIISTWHASIPEMVTNNIEGLLVDKQNPQQIADSIILLNGNSWVQFAKNCRLTYENKFSKEVVRNQLLNVFINA